MPSEHPRELLKRYRLEARKGLGQNFLVPGNAERIVRAAGIAPGDAAVEIGPGLGALTEALLDAGASVTAVELDAKMAALLRERLGSNPKLELIEADARELDLAAIAAKAGKKLRLLGNLPYYLSSPLLRMAAAAHAHLVDATFTLQKEVAERVASPPGSRVYGALTVLTTVWADASIVLRLPPGAFHPRPGVDSAVLRLVFRDTPRARIADEALFERVVFAAFGQRRKTILNSMRGAPDAPLPKEAVPAALAQAGIDPQRRAETVSVEEFGRLAAAVATAAGR